MCINICRVKSTCKPISEPFCWSEFVEHFPNSPVSYSVFMSTTVEKKTWGFFSWRALSSFLLCVMLLVSLDLMCRFLLFFHYYLDLISASDCLKMVSLELCSWGHSLRLLLQRSGFTKLQVYFIALIFGHTSFWEKAIPWCWSCNLRWGEESHVTLDAAVLCSPAVPKYFFFVPTKRLKRE